MSTPRGGGLDPAVAREIQARVQEAAINGLRIGAEAILTKAINLCPIDTGTLRRSGTVTVGRVPPPGAIYSAAKGGSATTFTEPLGPKPLVFISFNTPYAKKQHEQLNWHHPIGGQAKYLEQPFESDKDLAIKYAAKMIQLALRRGL